MGYAIGLIWVALVAGVIRTKQLEGVAAVLIGNQAAPVDAQAGNARYAEECLQAAGIRLVRIDPATPPRHHEVRALIYDSKPRSREADDAAPQRQAR